MSANSDTIPIYVIAYNNLTFVQSFVQQIIKFTDRVVIVDNGSTYRNLLVYYDFLELVMKEKIVIYRLKQNYGHNVYIVRPDLFPNVYIISDPDLLLNEDMPTDCCQRLQHLSITYQAYKVGLALDISDNDKFIKDGYGTSVYNAESKFWKDKISSQEYELFAAPIDTTFTLVNRNVPNLRCIRVAGIFTCKHLPWYEGYLENNIPTVELQHWTKNNVSSSILQHHDPTTLEEPICLLSALYGTDERKIDVTDKLQKFCSKSRIQISKHVDLSSLLGDPVINQQKKIVLVVQRGKTRATFELPEENRHLVETFKFS